jgi:iron complex transport system ATP-binding protein
MSEALLTIDSLELQLGSKRLCRNLNLRIDQGQTWGLLGRNGAGKTTLLHSILGLHHPKAGNIAIAGQSLESINRRQLAMQVGMLFQENPDALPATVLETVMLGRHPHSQSILGDSEQDLGIARRALEAFDLASLSERQVQSLSGGERQRLALAMLIAQQPRLYLLDEPSNHLDIAFQTRMLGILRRIARDDSASLFMATHDINLAARFCDYIVLMLPDGEHRSGPAEEILQEELLSAAYDCRIRQLQKDDLTLFYPEEAS